VQHNRSAKIIRAWHGTTLDVARSILNVGFASLAILDGGWFGNGIYFSTYPEYAFRYCMNKNDPCLVMCYLLLVNPYPIIYDDAKSANHLVFWNKGNYKNYGCNYVPVVQYDDVDFRPPKEGMQANYDEVVIFQENHILAHAVIALKKRDSICKSISISRTHSKSVKDWDCDDVVALLATMKLSKNYSDIIRSNNITGEVFATMTKEDWADVNVKVFGDVRMLVAKVTELSKAIM